MATPRSLETVNGMDYPEFISVFGSVIEHGSQAAAFVWGARPFPDTSSIHTAFTKFLHTLDPSSQKRLVGCYPDLAGKLAEEERLTKESTLEHRAAGLLDLTDSEKSELSLLNANYKDKFGFPFVVCARENKKETIRRELSRRMANTTEDELKVAIKEIIKIASYRIESLVNYNANFFNKL